MRTINGTIAFISILNGVCIDRMVFLRILPKALEGTVEPGDHRSGQVSTYR